MIFIENMDKQVVTTFAKHGINFGTNRSGTGRLAFPYEVSPKAMNRLKDAVKETINYQQTQMQNL